MSAYGGKADVLADPSERLLLARSGHSNIPDLMPKAQAELPLAQWMSRNPVIHIILVVECDTRMKFYDGRKYRGRGATCITGQEKRRVSNARHPVRQCCLGRDE